MCVCSREETVYGELDGCSNRANIRGNQIHHRGGGGAGGRGKGRMGVIEDVSHLSSLILSLCIFAVDEELIINSIICILILNRNDGGRIAGPPIT